MIMAWLLSYKKSEMAGKFSLAEKTGTFYLECPMIIGCWSFYRPVAVFLNRGRLFCPDSLSGCY